MGVQCFELRNMVDLALGHPEKGIVNLNLLHSLLHEILNKLDRNTIEELSEVSEKDISTEGRNTVPENELRVVELTENDSTNVICRDQKEI